KDNKSSENSDDPGPSSASTPKRRKPAKNPSFCESLNYSSSLQDYRSRGKCIRTEDRWFTPEEFVKQERILTDGHWKKDILCHGKTLNFLLKVANGREQIKRRAEEEEEEEEDMADLSVFQASSLPVTCVSLTGTLYKYRFASGSRGKCIRTEDRWFTPEEFVKQERILTDGHWKKDILCNGKTLNFLLQKEILHVHSVLCECVKCSIQEEINNDDECYVCYSEGDLVCCDECPRAFHSHCHLPTADGDSPGEWICTLCVLRNSQQWHDSSNMSEQEAFNVPVSQYRLHCHSLLLCVYRKDIKKVPRYSEFITRPMWLDRIKQKLDSGAYQTVGAFISDFQLIFSNCSKFNRDNEFGRIGTRLKQIFDEEFQRIFSISIK
uniref:SP110 nuclear body protein, tandem duplicate 1 n=1 Tax=Sinocyclocheilus grahami TaxID=75366 RepID=A0A672RWF8_SINGR